MGGRHSMTEEKVNRLKDVGFAWIVEDKKVWLAEGDPPADRAHIRDGSSHRKRGRPRKIEDNAAATTAAMADGQTNSTKMRPIRPKWLAMLQVLREYKEQHGTCEIPRAETSERLVAARQWAKNQKNLHLRWRQGQEVGMTQEKADVSLCVARMRCQNHFDLPYVCNGRCWLPPPPYSSYSRRSGWSSRLPGRTCTTKSTNTRKSMGTLRSPRRKIPTSLRGCR